MVKVPLCILAVLAFAAAHTAAPNNIAASQTTDPKVQACIAKVLEVRDGLQSAVAGAKSASVNKVLVEAIEDRIERANSLIERHLHSEMSSVDNEKQRYYVLMNAMLELDIAANDYILLDPTESTPKEKSGAVKHFRQMQACHTAVLNCYERDGCRF